MGQELTGKYVSSTYLNLVQHVSDNYYDGGGNLLNISDTSSLENTLSSYVSDSSLSNDFIWNNGYLEASLGSIMGLDAYATNVSVGTAFLTNASIGNLSQLTYSLNSSLGFKADLTYVDSSFALKTDLAKTISTLKIIDDVTFLSTGDSQQIMCIPSEINGYSLINAQAFITSVSSSTNAISIQVRKLIDNIDMLSTPITIDGSQYTSYTATTPSVINTLYKNVSTGDLISIDVDSAGTNAKGLGVILTFNS